MGKPRWSVSTIQAMLRNEKYMGDALLQKTYTADFLNKKSVKNHGEVEQVRVKGDHEAIIEPEIWDAVQLELQRRHRYTEEHNIRFRGRNSDAQPFSCKVICGVCGNRSGGAHGIERIKQSKFGSAGSAIRKRAS